MTIHEQMRERLMELGESIQTMKKGSEEWQKAVEEYGKLYKLVLEHEKIDEEVNDRRFKMDKDFEKLELELEQQNAQRKHERNMKILSLGGLFAAFTGGIVAENHGLLVPKITEFFKRI